MKDRNKYMYYKEPITTTKQAKNFLKEFYKEYPIVHPEDDMSNIVNTKDNSRTFTDEQVEDIHTRFDEVYSIIEDPCLYIIEEQEYERQKQVHAKSRGKRRMGYNLQIKQE